jgi:hypothetical protein
VRHLNYGHLFIFPWNDDGLLSQDVQDLQSLYFLQ